MNLHAFLFPLFPLTLHTLPLALQRLYAHCRHPLMLGPLTLLLLAPTVTTDRLALALAYTVYNAVAFRTDWVGTWILLETGSVEGSMGHPGLAQALSYPLLAANNACLHAG